MFRRRHWFVLLLGSVFVGWMIWGRSSSTAAELPSPLSPGQYEITTTSEGFERTAVVHIPKGYQATNPPPLVIVLHGGGGGADSILNHDNWAAKADQEGFVVVAPNGLPARPRLPANFLANPQVWNTGQLRDGSPRSRIDDVAYIRTLLDELKTKVPHDASQVFATGHSNGGSMTFRLGAEMSDRLSAIGTVAGMLAIEKPKPAKPLPMLYIYGTEDPLLPLDGGESTLPWGTRTTPAVESFLKTWAEASSCASEPKVVAEDDAIKKVRYPSTNNGPEVTVLYLKGHGHSWPGANRRIPSSMTGPNVSKLNATDELWSFFKKSVE